MNSDNLFTSINITLAILDSLNSQLVTKEDIMNTVQFVYGNMIPTFPGYSITKTGDVYSHRFGKVKLLKPAANEDGYLCVNLMVGNGTRKTVSIHRLMADTYLGPKPDVKAPCVRHLNDVKTDNRIENLAWGSAKENAQDALKNGKTVQGEKHWRTKLDNSMVAQIKESLRAGVKIKTLAAQYEVTICTISNIKSGKTWKSVQ